MFDTPVTEVTLVVVDPGHERFGETAKLNAHDWRESGDYLASFADGSSGRFHDGRMSTDVLLPQATCLRSDKGRDIVALRDSLKGAQEELSEIAKVAQNNRLPHTVRMQAKKEFWEIIRRLTKSELIH